MKKLVVEFQGNHYVLVGDLTDGAITTEAAYLSGEVSFAHVLDGRIMRFGRQIGITEDLKVVGETTIEPGVECLFGLLGPTWDRRCE